jgi:hypothetical protein
MQWLSYMCFSLFTAVVFWCRHLYHCYNSAILNSTPGHMKFLFMQFSTFQVYQFHFGCQQLQSLQNYDGRVWTDRRRETFFFGEVAKTRERLFAPETMAYYCAMPQTFFRVLVALEAKGRATCRLLVSYGCGCGRRVHRVDVPCISPSWDDATFRSTASSNDICEIVTAFPNNFVI